MKPIIVGSPNIVAEEEKRVMATRLEERISDVQKLTNTQLDIMSHSCKSKIKSTQMHPLDIDITNPTPK